MMKRLFSYKTWRNILCATGLPFVTMLMSSCQKYGAPDAIYIQGTVVEQESQNPIEGVSVKTSRELTTTDSNGSFMISTRYGCDEFNFSKDGYKTTDTTLCEAENIRIEMEEIP